jgi:mannose-6-phosphate isomerase-like protein (cupin superfamily)
MERASEVLEMEPFGINVEFLRTGEDTGGTVFEMEVSGRPRGFFAQRQVHPSQTERLEVVSGAMKVAVSAREQVLTEGQSIEIPPGTPHTQAPLGQAPGRVRIQVRPAGQTRAFLEYLLELCREGKVMRWGYPRPVAAASSRRRVATTRSCM